MSDDSSSAVAASASPEAYAVPPGWVLRYDEHGRPAMLRQDDAAAWEHEHGVVAEKYDLDVAESRLVAAHAAVAPVVSAALAEFRTLGYLRDASYSTLNAALYSFVDAYRWLFTVIGQTLPREAEVADFAHIQATVGTETLLPSLRERLQPLAARLPAERLDAYRAQLAQQSSERQAQA